MRHESGQVAMWLTLVVAGFLLTLGVVYFTQFAQAADEDSALQNAADAAALAAAQSIAKDAPSALAAAVLDGENLTCGMGQSAAADFANRNDTTLVQYCYYPQDDRIDVRVRSNDVTATGEREEATAHAEVGARLGPCSVPTRPTPSPTPGPDESEPTPSPSPTPPPDILDTAHCGDVSIEITFPSDGGDPRLSSSVDLDLTARLTA